jgi:hypothetical protein
MIPGYFGSNPFPSRSGPDKKQSAVHHPHAYRYLNIQVSQKQSLGIVANIIP